MSVSCFTVKVCGAVGVESGRAIAGSSADAVGLNFYSHSPRYLDAAAVETLQAVLPPELIRVGVFVNASREQIEAAVESAGLDFIQLHGDEPLEMISDLPGGRVIRAIRAQSRGVEEIHRVTSEASRIGVSPVAYLIDAFEPGAYGGTGKTVDWNSLAAWSDWCEQLVLAGGLTAENVAAAIETVRPTAVDTASGVESAPGLKDPQLTSLFASRAQDAFRRLSEPG